MDGTALFIKCAALAQMRQLPNIITLSRVLFLILIAWLTAQEWRGAATITFVLSIIAAASDWLDGYVARRWALITNLGKLLDAIVDKIMVVGLFLVLLFTDLLARDLRWLEIVSWGIIGATVVRDLLITGIRMVVAKRGLVLAADKAGKRKTIWQITAICVLFFVPVLHHDLPHALGGGHTVFSTWVWINGVLYFLLSGFLTVYSGTQYLIKYWPHLMKRPEGENTDKQ